MYEVVCKDSELEIHIDAEGFDISWAVALSNVVSSANEAVVTFWANNRVATTSGAKFTHETRAVIPLREIIAIIKRDTDHGIDEPPKPLHEFISDEVFGSSRLGSD